ncbi:MAG: cytochrome c [Gemmataceae bacterium]
MTVVVRRMLPIALLAVLATTPGAAVTPFAPKFEAVAETQLLMEGLADANHRSLQRQLRAPPADTEAWTVVRGQALLIAETGNLLLIRPPRSGGRDTWMRLSTELRTAATALARKAADKDYPGGQAALTALTASCNRCHETFRVPVRVGPEPATPLAERSEPTLDATRRPHAAFLRPPAAEA